MILNFFNRFLTNRFFIDVGTLVSGSFLGQLILLIATPFLTRIYSPEDFGVYFIYISFSTVLKRWKRYFKINFFVGFFSYTILLNYSYILHFFS